MVTDVIPNTPAAWSERAQEPFSWDACGWSRNGQETRFRAVLGHLDARDGDTLLDFGSGTGAFSAWLPTSVDYVGWDWAPGMRERSRDDYPLRAFPDDRPVCGFDHVVAIGCFNLPDCWSKTETFLELDRLWRQATRSLIVSLYRGRDERCLAYTAGEVTRFADSTGGRWKLDASYLDNDLMLVVRR